MHKKNEIQHKDSLAFLKELPDFSVDINYSDPPYGLGSEVIIRPDGKPDYDKASDFMSKWDMPTGTYWEQWFKEVFRTLKHGGYCIMFGMDRQLLLFKYYAHLAGFSERQSLYWFYISNFPKASDLSKNLDKNAGVERRKISEIKRGDVQNAKEKGVGYLADNANRNNEKQFGYGVEEITVPSTPIAKKYNEFKYSISPLKQTNETIMVFQKPYKTNSCLHDTLAYENGDIECCCGALNIDGGRVPTNEELGRNNITPPCGNMRTWDNNNLKAGSTNFGVRGRYPAQTFVNSEAADMLDEQSGIKNPSGCVKGTEQSKTGTENCYGIYDKVPFKAHQEIAGCSKILHKCDFEKDEHDLYFYCSKVSNEERNGGLTGFEEKRGGSMETNITDMMQLGGASLKGTPKEIQPTKNSHPTLKPISLNERILKLFKTPNPQKIIYPFAGSFSEVIGGWKAGFTDFSGCELSEDYLKIGEARFKHWTAQKTLMNCKRG